MSYENIYVCGKCVITFVKRTYMSVLCNTDHVDTRYQYPIENTKNGMKYLKDTLLVSNTMKQLTTHQCVHTVLKTFDRGHLIACIYQLIGDYVDKNLTYFFFGSWIGTLY